MPMDELLSRAMPHSPEAEQAVLGSMLIDADCIKDVMDKLQPQDFYLQQNREIFETIYSMFIYSRPIDGVTVAREMEKNGVYRDDTRAYLLQLMEVTPTSANVMEYAGIIRDKALLRSMAKAAGDIAAMVQEGVGNAGEILASAEQKIYAIRQGREINGLRHIKSVINDVYDQLDELAANPGKLPGIPTGFADLDNALGGLNKSDLILIAARPGMGKTSFALNLVLSAAQKSGKDVAIFQLEMSDMQLTTRMISSEALVDSYKLRSGELGGDDWGRIAETVKVLADCEIFIDDTTNITVTNMKAKLRRIKNLGFVVIDYLQLMKGESHTENRVNEVGDISRNLKIMAKELGIPVMVCAQLSRASEKRDDKRPMLSDLRDSGAIEQDADMVLFLYRDEYYSNADDALSTAEVIVAKNRHGSLERGKMGFQGQFTRFTTLDRDHE